MQVQWSSTHENIQICIPTIKMCYMYFPIQLHVMSNQLNLPQVDSDQIVETFDR